jgi:hypothetical protein
MASQLLVLKLVFLAEDDDRHRRPVGQLPAPPAVGERRGRGGNVAQRSERLDGAALHGRRVAGDRGEHVTAAQQFLGMCLVFDAQPERGAVPFGHR